MWSFGGLSRRNEMTTETMVHRQAFMGFIPFTVAMAIVATILYFSYPLVGFLLTILGFIPLILEFLMYKQFIDPLFKGHTSHNLIIVTHILRCIYLAHCARVHYSTNLFYFHHKT